MITVRCHCDKKIGFYMGHIKRHSTQNKCNLGYFIVGQLKIETLALKRETDCSLSAILCAWGKVKYNATAAEYS